MYIPIPNIDTNVFAVISRFEKGEHEVLVQAERSIDPRYAMGIQVKFPGGKFEASSDLELTDALRRELFDELYLRLRQNARVTKLKDYIEKNQLKIWYHIPFEDFDGELRKEVIRDGSSALSVPWWAKLGELGILYPTHRYAIPDISRHLLGLDRKPKLLGKK